MSLLLSSDFSKQLRIAIVGGGIGGLATAVALQQKGFQVTIYERDGRFGDRRQGYGLTLTNNKKGPLADLGLLQKCIEEDCPSNAHWVFNPQGDILGYYGRIFKKQYRKTLEEGVLTDDEGTAADTVEQVVNRGNLRIPRELLRKMLLEKLHPGTIVWGVKLVDYEENSSGVRLKLIQDKKELDLDSSSAHSEEVSESGNISSDSSSVEENSSNNSSNITEVEADLLVGADGTRSFVRRLRALKDVSAKKRKWNDNSDDKNATEDDPDPSPLRYLGVSVILGITTAEHPLINGQGFYVLDGENRFFTMPFEVGKSADTAEKGGVDTDVEGGVDATATIEGGVDNATVQRPQLTMWQLSFSGLPESEARQFKSAKPEDLLAEAVRRTSKWFKPVADMLANTPLKEVWGTALYDRDPMQLRTRDQKPCRVTVIGDACHPMSMFKGQGANQALQDGPLLAGWLSRPGLSPENIFTRLRCFEREMVSRVSGKVAASRIAAAHLHSPAALSDDYGIEGVMGDGNMQSVLTILRNRKIGASVASTGSHSDDVAKVSYTSREEEQEQREKSRRFILETKVLEIITAVESETRNVI